MTQLRGDVDRRLRRRVSGWTGRVGPARMDPGAFGRVMDDLKKLSVERLRDLAREHLGRGHSRLRTKAQLLEALKAVVSETRAGAPVGTGSAARPVDPVRVVDFPPGRRGRVRAERTGAEASTVDRGPPALPGPPRSGAPRQTARRNPSGGVSDTGRVDRGRARGARAGVATSVAARGNGPAGRALDGARRSEARAAEVAPEAVVPGPGLAELPVEEGFFELPAVPRRPRRAPAPIEPLEGEPFASPREVGTEAPVLLVRDPTTLFVFWDFRRELERGAALGLREPRLLLRIHRGDDLDRSLELPLTARSTYVTGLLSGEQYTAEVLLLGRDGWTRPVGSRSGVRRLPPGRVSGQLEVRTLRLPWTEPLSRAPAPSDPGSARHEPLGSPRRVPLPTSPGARGPEGARGPSGGPRSGRA